MIDTEPEGSSRRPNARRGRSWILFASGLLLLLLAVPGGLGRPTASVHAPVAPTVRTDLSSGQLVAATTSLEHGGGPAFGTPTSCQTIGPSVSCSSPKISAHPLTSPKTVWSNLTKGIWNVPSTRYYGVMAYDAADGYVVLFGGISGSGGYLSDTWTFSEGTWTSVGASGPSARFGMEMAYDAGDGYVVLFGGYTVPGYTYQNDTWSYSAGVWTNITNATQAPEARYFGTMSYDAKDGYLLLYGGYGVYVSGGSYGYGDIRSTWTFTKGNWTNITKSVSGSPGGVQYAASAYDANDGYVVLFGGCGTISCPNSATYKYVNKTWTSLSLTTHPSSRYGMTMTYDPSLSEVILFGGYPGSYPTHDTWAFKGGSWTNITSTFSLLPPWRYFASLAWDGADGYAVLFGGYGWGYNGSTYFYSFWNDTWALGPTVITVAEATPSVIDLGQTAHFNATAIVYSRYTNHTWYDLPPGCTNANLSILSCTPNATGNYTVAVNISDGAGSSANHTLNLTVRPLPVITSFSASLSTVTTWTATYLNSSATSGSGGYSFAYLGLPPGCGSANTTSLKCVPSKAGNYTVKLVVTDAVRGKVNTTLNLTVNAAPSIVTFVVGPSVVDVGQPIHLNVSTRGGTPPLSYAYSGLPTGCASVNAPALTCVASTQSVLEVGVLVTDTFGWHTNASAFVTVNIDPVVNQFTVAPVVGDATHAVTFYSNVTGGTQPLSYALNGLPPGCTSANQSVRICTPSQSGTYTVELVATDLAGFSVFANTTLTLNAPPSGAVLNTSVSVLDVGQNLTLQTTFVGGTAPYTYAYTSLPTGCVSAKVANLTCAPRRAGTFTVTVTVTDRFGLSTQVGRPILVNLALTIGNFSSSFSEVTVGSGVAFSSVVVGGTPPFTYSYSGLPTGCSSANAGNLSCAPAATGSYSVVLTVADSVGMEVARNLTLTVSPKSPTSSLGGLGALPIILLIVAAVAVVAAVVVLRGRRGGRNAGSSEEPPAESAETAVEGETTYGGTGEPGAESFTLELPVGEPPDGGTP